MRGLHRTGAIAREIRRLGPSSLSLSSSRPRYALVRARVFRLEPIANTMAAPDVWPARRAEEVNICLCGEIYSGSFCDACGPLSVYVERERAF